MTRQEIIHKALENLQKQAPVYATWEETGSSEQDGRLLFNINNRTVRFYVEVKNELRSHQLPRILGMAQQYQPFMVAAARLNSKIKEALRQNDITYIEANGNAFLKTDHTFLLIEGNKPVTIEKEVVSRAFTKTGLKVLFHFLLDKTLINQPYRQIAELTGTSFGNISNIIAGMKQGGYLISIAKDRFQFQNKHALLNKWIAAYDLSLKPTLKTGSFRFLKTEDFNNWESLPLDGNTLWGAEPAGALLTNYLKPATLTMYTTETRAALMKNYRMVPDDNGNILVFKKFWNDGQTTNRTVPPLLAYADLVNTADRRCIETAEKIYHEFLQDKL